MPLANTLRFRGLAPARRGLPDSRVGPTVRVHGLTKRYGDRTVLRDVELTFRPGETVTILGPNGAGKSTLLEILEGFRRRTSGYVRVLGVDPQVARARWRTSVGVVLQYGEQTAKTTVREMMQHFSHLYPYPRPIDEVLLCLGLGGEGATRVERLSGGQRRRLDVALAILGRPRIVFLDEPTAGLDPDSKLLLWSVVRSLQSEGVTVVMTTHDLAEAETLSDWVVVMAAGTVVADGAPNEIGATNEREYQARWTDDRGQHTCFGTEPASLLRELDRAGLSDRTHDLHIGRPTLEDRYRHVVRDAQLVSSP